MCANVLTGPQMGHLWYLLRGVEQGLHLNMTVPPLSQNAGLCKDAGCIQPLCHTILEHTYKPKLS